MRSFCVFQLLAAVTTASAIHELTSQEFGSFIEGNETSVVAFVAPWCMYCQELAPEFESAAARLQNESLPLATVDCEAEKDLCRQYKVPIYPTIRVFHGREHFIYDGLRKADAMVSFARRHSRPVVTTLLSTLDVDEFRTKDRVAVVAYIDREDDASTATFAEIADMYRGQYLFASIADDSFGLAEDLTKPSIVLYKSFDEGRNVYAQHFDKEDIETFLSEVSSPLIREVGVDLNFFAGPLASGRPIAFIFAEEREERARLIEELRPVAQATKDQLVWVTADPMEYAERAAQVALRPGRWPAFAIEDHSNDFKFAFPKRGLIEDLSGEAVGDVVNKFLAGELESTTISEPIPTYQDGSVIDIVADTYQDMVMNNDKDVLVLFYSPTCNHCNAMAPTYERLGDMLKPYADRITVAKIDATNNDIWPRVSSFPTLKLFVSHSKDVPVVYSGNRTVKDFVGFVKDKGSRGVVEGLGESPEAGIPENGHDEL